MAHDVFHQLYYHIVWSTHQRQPMLSNTLAKEWLIGAIVDQATKRKARVLACNAMPDHVHLLVSLPPCDLALFIGQVKGATSHTFNREFSPKLYLKWQDGYGSGKMATASFHYGEATAKPSLIMFAAKKKFTRAAIYGPLLKRPVLLPATKTAPVKITRGSP